MKKLIWIILLTFSTYNINAETDSKKQLVDELIVLTNVAAMVDMMYSQMEKVTQNMTKQLGIKPSENEYQQSFKKKMFTLLREELNWDKMEEPTRAIYLKHYTEQELRDIVAFYKTESGKSMVTKMPLIVQDSMMMTQALMKDFIPKLQKLREELVKELEESRKPAQ